MSSLPPGVAWRVYDQRIENTGRKKILRNSTNFLHDIFTSDVLG